MDSYKSQNSIPTFIVHYSRGTPFRSITGVPSSQRQQVIGKLNETNAWGLNRFSDQLYLQQRFETESHVRNAFMKKGGRPQLMNPIYFFLGRNLHFEEHELNKGYKIDLQKISSDAISFTYGDSMLAFNESNGTRSGIKYQNPLCTNVYSFEELDLIFSSPHFPKEDPLAIEAQLWIEPAIHIVESLL